MTLFIRGNGQYKKSNAYDNSQESECASLLNVTTAMIANTQ
jgi:hypothetical protein